MNMLKEKSYFMWLFVLLTYFLLALRDISGLNIPQYFIVAVAFIYLPFSNYKNLVTYCGCLIPLIVGMNVIIITFVLAALYIKAPKINICQYIFLLYFIPAEILMFSTLPTNHRINDLVIYFSVLGLFFFLLFDKNTDVDYSAAIKMFCYSGVFTLVLVAYHFYDKFGMSGLFMQRMDDIYKFDNSIKNDITIFTLNANNTGYFSVVIYACLLLGIKRLHIPSLLYWSLMTLNLLIAGLTVSRTWLILIVFISLLYGIFCLSKIKLTVLIVGIILFGGSLPIIFEDYTSSFETRLHSDSMEDGNGRVELFEEYAEYMETYPEYLPFGTGTVSYKDIIPIHNSMHNSIQQIFVCTGVIGLILFAIVAVVFYRMFMRNKKIPFIFYLPLIGSSIFLQTIQFLNPYFLMLPICICAMAIKMGAKERLSIHNA